MKKPYYQSPFWRVVRRELQRMTSRRLYLWAALILPLFVVLFMATIFNTGQMENIPVAVVDQDFSATSRTITRMLDASPTLNVTEHLTNPADARQAMQEKRIYGYVVIPSNFERDVSGNRETALCYYYHYALLSVGCEIKGAFELILQTVSAAPLLIESEALGLPENEIMPMIEPTTLQAHPIYNPDLDYSIYLTQPFFFIIFQVLILLVTVYSVGAEMKFGTAEEWLTEANGSIVTAIFGKLLPYTVMFILVSIFANAIFFGVMNIPYTNNFIGINLVSIVFVLATQGFGLFIFALFPAMSIIISIASMVGSLGATLSGVTFPLPSMYLFFYYASYAFPIRYYIESIQTMLYTEGTILYVWPQVSVLIFFLALPITILRHLKTTIFNHKYDNIE